MAHCHAKVLPVAHTPARAGYRSRARALVVGGVGGLRAQGGAVNPGAEEPDSGTKSRMRTENVLTC
ncbi:MAG: hypothetical protein ACYDHX_03880 [Methanothrix sp.]